MIFFYNVYHIFLSLNQQHIWWLSSPDEVTPILSLRDLNLWQSCLNEAVLWLSTNIYHCAWKNFKALQRILGYIMLCPSSLPSLNNSNPSSLR